jgi:hypothetical protein
MSVQAQVILRVSFEGQIAMSDTDCDMILLDIYTNSYDDSDLLSALGRQRVN